MNKKEDISKKIERLIEQNTSMLDELNQLKELIKEESVELKHTEQPVIAPPVIPVIPNVSVEKTETPLIKGTEKTTPIIASPVKPINEINKTIASPTPPVQKPKKNLEKYIGENILNKNTP
jgi:hypothetical protein